MIMAVSCEILITAIPTQGDSNVLASQLAEVIGGNRRRVRERLTVVLNQLRQYFCSVWRHLVFAVLGSQLFRYETRNRRLVECLLTEGNGKCLNRRIAALRHQRDDRA